MKLPVLALLLLAGCTGQGGYAVIDPFPPVQHVTSAELAASDDATCKSYGAVFGSSDYIQCREHLSDQRQATSGTATIGASTASATTPAPSKTASVTRNFCYHDGSEMTCTPSQ